MDRIADFVLAHRKRVMLFWLVLTLAGAVATGRTIDRLTTDFSVPGQPGFQTADAINKALGQLSSNGPSLPVLARRTRISIESWDRGVSAAPVVADLMGDVLGWSPAQRIREVEHYVARVEAERDAQRQPTDQTADAARLGAPDIVPLH